MISIGERIPTSKSKEIFSLIRKKGILPKFELLGKTNLPSSTLTRILDELTQSGWVLEAGFGESTGGRRPILYEVNPTNAYVFGLDISRTISRLSLFDLHLKKLDSIDWDMTAEFTPDYFIHKVSRSIHEMQNRHQIPTEKIVGMGIGAVGPLDRTRGIILNPPRFRAPDWENIQICRIFEEEFNFPVQLDNGANTSILGEYWAEQPEAHDHLLYVHVGAGVRSAMMSCGQVFYGAANSPGSTGQMIIQADGNPSLESNGNYGTLESYVAIPALVQQVKSRLRIGRKSLINDWVENTEQVNFNHLLLALQANDPMITEIFTQAAAYLGIGLANLIHILRPDKVILGGPLLTTNCLFFEIATQVALKKTYDPSFYQAEFSKGRLGRDAISTGAAVMIINQLAE